MPTTHAEVGRSTHQAPPELDRTFYRSDRGAFSHPPSAASLELSDMLSVAVKVKHDTEKNVKVSGCNWCICIHVLLLHI